MVDTTAKMEFEKLPEAEKARVISVGALLKHIRGLEDAGLIQPEYAKKHIGYVKILEAQILGKFVPKK